MVDETTQVKVSQEGRDVSDQARRETHRQGNQPDGLALTVPLPEPSRLSTRLTVTGTRTDCSGFAVCFPQHFQELLTGATTFNGKTSPRCLEGRAGRVKPEGHATIRERGSKGPGGDPSQPLFSGGATMNYRLCFPACSRCGGHRATPGTSVAHSSRATLQYPCLVRRLLLYKGIVPQAIYLHGNLADIP